VERFSEIDLGGEADVHAFPSWFYADEIEFYTLRQLSLHPLIIHRYIVILIPILPLVPIPHPASSVSLTTSPRHLPPTQIARAKAIKSHYLQTQAHSGADARKQADIAAQGVIVSLGLIKPDGGDVDGKDA
jgi:hypothetical protein